MMKKLMLDTHALLWAIGKSDELSSRVLKEITDSRNEVCVSAISIWEIALKCSLGKLALSFDVKDIPKYCKQMEFSLISLEVSEALGVVELPQKENHKDPFDRMLIYQCIQRGYTLVSKDSKMKFYKDCGLNCMW